MSSPVNFEDLIFADMASDECEVLRAYLQAIAVMRADLQYRINGDDGNKPATDFLKEIFRYGPALYAEAANTGNAFSATLPIAFTALPELTGRVFILKLAGGNDSSSTLNINALGPIAINKAGGVALAGGEMVGSKLALFVYNGSTFHLLNPEAPTARSSVQSTEPYELPAKGTVRSIPRPAGAKLVQAVLECVTDDGGGYVDGMEADVRSAMEDIGSTARVAAFTITTTETAWKFARSNEGSHLGTELVNQSDGTQFKIDDAKWRIRVDYL